MVSADRALQQKPVDHFPRGQTFSVYRRRPQDNKAAVVISQSR